jgi:Flp pilus assembly protein TadG
MDRRRGRDGARQTRHRPRPLAADGGQAVPVVAAALALVMVLGLGAVRLAGVVTDRARAHSAADAAALAGVVEGRSGAERLAAANGGRVTAFERSGDEIEVRVRVGDAEATARARLEPFDPFGP